METSKQLFRIAALLMALAVIIGAIGAHMLKGHIAPELMPVYQTGSLYHLVHALALLAISALPTSILSEQRKFVVGLLFIFSIFIFSGSLYVLAITGVKKLGAITPLGGLGFIVGWLILAITPKSKA